VAEIGVNWDGDFDLAKEMMFHAKKTGCNAVKFQAYTNEMVKDHPQKKRLENCSVTKENVNKISTIAKNVGIEWFCTPMYPEAVDFLNPFVSRFKIREHDGRELLENKSTPLLDKVFATDKEVIVSTQYSTNNCTYKKNVKWLYCVPKYPCVLEDLDFKSLDEYDGFSNHCRQIIAPITAAILGSKIIEIHISANRTLDYIDNNVSFDFNELSEIVSQIRLSEKIQK
jgi:N,N'-diacetyllegionaminate synthase